MLKKMKHYFLLFLFLFPFVSYAYNQKDEGGRISVQEYINTYKQIAIENMIEYKIPASITLAQGILESAYGNSELAKYANNHFGIKCHKSWEGETYYIDDDEINECFRKYKTPQESYTDHSLFLCGRERYADLFKLDLTDYKGWAHGLKKAGYATSPSYAPRLIEIVEQYKLYEIDIIVVENYIGHSYQDISIQTNDNNTSINNIDLNAEKRVVGKHNKIKYTLAEKGDTYETIAYAFDMMPWQILKYNDLDKQSVLEAGERIYLQPKRNKAKDSFHIVKSNETMRDISQEYGIKLKNLYKYNNLKMGTEIVAGQKIKLMR